MTEPFGRGNDARDDGSSTGVPAFAQPGSVPPTVPFDSPPPPQPARTNSPSRSNGAGASTGPIIRGALLDNDRLRGAVVRLARLRDRIGRIGRDGERVAS